MSPRYSAAPNGDAGLLEQEDRVVAVRGQRAGADVENVEAQLVGSRDVGDLHPGVRHARGKLGDRRRQAQFVSGAEPSFERAGALCGAALASATVLLTTRRRRQPLPWPCETSGTFRLECVHDQGRPRPSGIPSYSQLGRRGDSPGACRARATPWAHDAGSRVTDLMTRPCLKPVLPHAAAIRRPSRSAISAISRDLAHALPFPAGDL